MNLATHYYLLRLKEALQCKQKDKRGILKIMASSLREYHGDHRKCSFEELARYFGTPESVASSYWPDGVIPTAKVLTCRIILKLVLTALVGLLALVGLYFLVIALLHQFASAIPVYKP